MEHGELIEAIKSLGFGPNQTAELLSDPDRAGRWIEWARAQGRLANPAATIMKKFRSDEEPADPSAWRETKGEAGPNYPKLLRAAESLVRNTAHEYDDVILREEFVTLGDNAKVGNGARLTDSDEERLLATAASIRVRHAKNYEPPAYEVVGDDGLTAVARQHRERQIRKGADPEKFTNGATPAELDLYRRLQGPKEPVK